MAFLYRNKYTNNYLLEQSKLSSLKIRRLRAMAMETNRIIYKTSPVFIHDIVKIKQNSYNFRYNNTADIPRPRTTRYGRNSFSYEAARLWNSLPDQARNLSTFGTFKNFISTLVFF
jgi:hypothetical protein